MTFFRPTRLFALIAVAVTVNSCATTLGTDSPDGMGPRFVHETSDLSPDPAVVYGYLDNGLRYAILPNPLPSGTAALRMQISSGSVNESDSQRGLAHFLEHMAFNGSANVPEGEMVKRLERYGLAFGADTNASTGFHETTYKLDLPRTDEDVLQEAFFLMRETASNLLLEESAIDRERGIIASEKLARETISFNAFVHRLAFLTMGSGLVDRLPIGTDDVIANAPRDEFVSYYQDFYHPENTTIVFVGDVAPEQVEQLIRTHFADWSPPTALVPDTVLPQAPLSTGRFGLFYDPDTPTTVALFAPRPYEDQTDSKAERERSAIRQIGFGIVNRRLARMANEGDERFLSGSVSTYRYDDIAMGSAISMRTTPALIPSSIAAAEQEVHRALEFGFTDAEIDEQLRERRSALELAVASAGTRRTTGQFGSGLIDRLLNSIRDERVFEHPSQTLARFDAYSDQITPDAVTAAFREAWGSFGDANIYVSTNQETANIEEIARTALAESRAVPVTPPEDRADMVFAYTEFGAPGTIAEKQYLPDADATLYRFSNNVRLNVKKTSYTENQVSMTVRVGEGTLAMPRKDEALRRLSYNLLRLGGLEAHSEDELGTIFAGKNISTGYRLLPDSDSLSVLGASSVEDFPDLMNLATARVIAPGYRPEARFTYLRSLEAFFPTYDATPGGAAAKDLPRILASGDGRFGYPDFPAFEAVDSADAIGWLTPLLASGAIEVSVVGDIDPERLVAEVARTFGALPMRNATRQDYPAMSSVVFPPGRAAPVIIGFGGESNQAQLRLFWPTGDAKDTIYSARMRVVQSALRNRLTEVIREELGATYSPGVAWEGSDVFDGYGYIAAIIDVTPQTIDTVQRRVEQVVRSIRQDGFSADEFDRAVTPRISDLDSAKQNNGFWLAVLADAQSAGSGLEMLRLRDSAFRDMTLADVNAMTATLFDPADLIAVHLLPYSVVEGDGGQE